MSKTIGNFYLKLTDAGNLIGEFSNTEAEGSFPESAWRKCKIGAVPFVGDYISTWYDKESGKSTAAELSILPKYNDSAGLFKLVWSESGKQTFHGQAMLCDGMLVGNYQSP